MSELSRERPADRYGTVQPRRRLLLIAATTVLAAVFLAWVIWAAWFHSDPAIDAAIAKYDVVGTHEIRVQVDTRFRNDAIEGTCLLRATAADHTVVGELNVTTDQLRADSGTWISVRTERRATTIELVRCAQTGG